MKSVLQQQQSAKAAPTLCDAAIVAMCISPSGEQIAFSPNTHIFHIANISGPECSTWTITHTMKEHKQPVTSLDWNATTGNIVSCAQDRAAFVWSYDAETKQWKPALVIAEVNMKRGFTSAAWNPAGTKAYIACASSSFSVAKFEPENNWWTCTPYTPHIAPITCVAGHPTRNDVVATGALDNFVKIISTYSKKMDGAMDKPAKPGTELGSFRVGGWVNAIAWSPSGCAITVASQDSTVAVFSCPGSDPTPAGFDAWVPKIVPLMQLPMRTILFLSETSIIAAGHDYTPYRFQTTAAEGPDGWKLTQKGTIVDKKEEKKSATAAVRDQWQNQANYGQKEAVEMPKTRHSNVINGIIRLPAHADPFKFATSSLDGRVEFWQPSDMSPV